MATATLRPATVTDWFGYGTTDPEVVGTAPWADETDTTYAVAYGPDFSQTRPPAAGMMAMFPALPEEAASITAATLTVRWSVHAEHDGIEHDVRGAIIELVTADDWLSIYFAAGMLDGFLGLGDGEVGDFELDVATQMNNAGALSVLLSHLNAGTAGIAFQPFNADDSLGSGVDQYFDSWLTVYRVSLEVQYEPAAEPSIEGSMGDVRRSFNRTR